MWYDSSETQWFVGHLARGGAPCKTNSMDSWPNYNTSPTAVCSEPPGQLMCPQYFTNLDFPEIRGIPLLFTIWGETSGEVAT